VNSYSFSLLLHNGMRWMVLLLGVLVLLNGFAGWMLRREWHAADERLHSAFAGVLSLQFLIGLILYAFISPLPAAFLTGLPATMKVPTIRFFMLDHPVSMFIGIAIVHGARAKSARAATGRARFRIVALSTALALAIILASIPWPGLRYGRPLVRTPQSETPGMPRQNSAPVWPSIDFRISGSAKGPSLTNAS
jgi:hypothetical protein